MADRFPVEDFWLKDAAWSLDGQRLTGGQSVSGLTQTARTDGGGYWTADLRFVLRSPDQVRRWRAFAARLSGGEETIAVPRCEIGLKVTLAAGVTFESVTHSDGVAFSDGTEYVIEPVVSAAFGGTAALRATQVQLNFTTAVDLLGGEVFSIVHANAGERMYQIKSIVSQSGNNYTVKISPPLREAVTTSTELDFDDPRCLMRVAEGFQAEMRGLRFSDPKPLFIEHFDPLPAS